MNCFSPFQESMETSISFASYEVEGSQIAAIVSPAIILEAIVTIDSQDGNTPKIVLPLGASGLVKEYNFVFRFPEEANIVFTVHSLNATNPALIQFTTDGSGVEGFASFSYNGTEWILLSSGYNE